MDSASVISATYINSSGTQNILSPTVYTLSLNPPVTGQLWGVGGTITYSISGSPIPIGSSLIVERNLPLQQLTSLVDQGNFYPGDVETALDTLEMQIQQLSGRTTQFRGIWQTDTVYNEGDIVQDGINGANTGNYYIALVGNLSGVWLTDLAAGDWGISVVATVPTGNITLTGAVTGSSPLGTPTVTTAAQMAANTVKVNNTNAPASPVDLTLPASTILARLDTGNIVAASIAQIQTLIGRIRLTGSVTYYVATTGSDSNPGTIGSPWLTIQHAINTIHNTIDLDGNFVTIQVADGTYGIFAFTTMLVGGNNTSITINGNSVTPSNVLISGAGGTGSILCTNGALGGTIQNLKITNSAGFGIFVSGGQVSLGAGIVFGACSAGHMFAFDNGIISSEGAYTINGNAASHFSVGNGGLIDVGVFVITLTGTPIFSTAFAVAQGSGSNIYFEAIASVPATFSGSATGVRYIANTNAVINTEGSGSTYLPGNAGGSTASGGQYI